MPTYDFQLVTVDTDDAGVCTATIDAPPCNVMTGDLYVELARFVAAVATDDDARVVVLRSADPEFFIAHFDVSLILQFPTDTPAVRSDELNAFHAMTETLRTMAKPTIAAVTGRVGGGGGELAASCDMRFGVLGRTMLNQMEVPLGILPGGSGTQRLPRLVGRGRAMEIILGGIDVDAETLERWGWLNRAFADVAAMDTYVDALVARMAGYPPQALALAKHSALNAEPDPREGLLDESHLFQVLLRDPHAQAAMRSFLELGGQTRDGERQVGDLGAAIRWR